MAKKIDDAYNLRLIYQDMELDLINSLKRNITRHSEEVEKSGISYEQWQLIKLKDLERYRQANIKIIGKYKPEIEELITETITETYGTSKTETTKEIKRNIKEIAEAVSIESKPDLEFFRADDNKFEELFDALENDFEEVNSAILSRTDDVYRQTIFKTQAYYNKGTVSLNQAIDMATSDFLSKGIDAITYKDGTRVNIASYAEMNLRTTNHRAYLAGSGKARKENDQPLIIVSAHATSCPLCQPWQGMVLIDDVYSGGTKQDGPHPLLSTAMNQGLMHPNCRHNVGTYYKGVTTHPNITNKEIVLGNYENEQKQRMIERKIRKQKRIVAGTIDPSNLKREKEKLLNLQRQMREHLKNNPQLRRQYQRERLY